MRLAARLASLILLAPAVARADDYPRRALVVHVGNYLYLNPLTSKSADGPDRVSDAAARLAVALRVPTGKTNNQLFVLSDADARAPTRAALLAAVRSFADTSRAQDRVLVYFAGHAFDKDGKAYLASIEGDPADPATLVPVADVYDALKGCKAAQTVVVWDVCRRNPTRPARRPDGGPMTDALAKALTAAPDGVQVLLACSPGETSLEYSDPKGDARLFAGSALLDALRQAAEDAGGDRKPDPADPLPVADLFPAVGKYVGTAAAAFRTRQTPRLAGKPPARLAAPDPGEAAATPVELATPKAAPEAKSILEELALPPLPLGADADPLPSLPFAPDSLRAYAPDVGTDDILKDAEKYPLRVAVLRSLQGIRDVWQPIDPRGGKLLTEVNAPPNDRVKRTVLDAQEPIAVAVVRLEEELDRLLAVGGHRGKEPRRWQAHYDYALAQVRARLAALHEYNLLLGHVRTENLPELPPEGTGWRLVPAESLHSRLHVKKLAEQAAAGFKTLAADHKGTPWEVLARRAVLSPTGLKWEPVPK